MSSGSRDNRVYARPTIFLAKRVPTWKKPNLRMFRTEDLDLFLLKKHRVEVLRRRWTTSSDFKEINPVFRIIINFFFFYHPPTHLTLVSPLLLTLDHLRPEVSLLRVLRQRSPRGERCPYHPRSGSPTKSSCGGTPGMMVTEYSQVRHTNRRCVVQLLPTLPVPDNDKDKVRERFEL